MPQILELDQPVLRRLVHAYERGRLVPFVGSGLSFPCCRLWEDFVASLQAEAGIEPGQEPQVEDDEPVSERLVREANTAVRSLRARDPDGYTRAVRRALWTDIRVTPNANAALSRIWWPLVLTTNLDQLAK